VIDGQLLKASISLGIALYPDHAADANGLMKASDYALKRASGAGGGFAHLFTPQDATALRAPAGRDTVRIGLTETQRLAQDLRTAVANNEISLVYQPIFRASDQALIGHEALARWNHKTDGLIGPVVFIPLAEQAGLIHEIGAHVLENACAEAVLRTPGLKIAVNLSPLQFRDPDLPARITAILRKTGLNPALLELEVTESLLIENAAAASMALQALRDIGVSVALDDFGTGYSSLSYLCDYPFARLKIDKRFIQALGTDANADAIVVAILALANNLKLDVTAEGVETEAQLEFLKKAGCSLVQGYLLGRPNARALTPPAPKLRAPPPYVPAAAAAGPPPVPQKRVPSRA
jgi:EAL domain-containing protein (putative c-di-GMP-specific phosphodiesterase class I)